MSLHEQHQQNKAANNKKNANALFIHVPVRHENINIATRVYLGINMRSQ